MKTGTRVAMLAIGEFSERTRLSAKALRLYDELGLVVPAVVDPASGYRYYDEDQIERARLEGVLRRLDLPLAKIGEILALDPVAAADALAAWWHEVEVATEQRRSLARYVDTRLRGTEVVMKTVERRTIPERALVSISRHVTIGETDAFFHEAILRLKDVGPGVGGVGGAPFLVFYGEVSEDSDGPVELSRPVAVDLELTDVGADTDIQRRVEAAHDEIFIRLSASEMSWPEMQPHIDTLYRWAHDHGVQAAGQFRQNLVARARPTEPDEHVCDLSAPLR